MSVLVSKIVVVLIAGYLIGLGVLAAARAPAVKKYLLAHASTPLAHYLELSLRLVCGWAILTCSPHMLAPGLFQKVGWVILITTAVLLILPWRLHRRFAKWSVPKATQHMNLIAIGSMLGGLILAYALVFVSGIEHVVSTS